MKKNIFYATAIFLAFISCKKNDIKTTENSTESIVAEKSDSTAIPTDSMATKNNTESNEMPNVNDALAEKIKMYLTTTFIKKADLDVMTANDKKFQLYQVDLNEDGKKEIFVYLDSPYFCGTGGCTVLLMSPEMKNITTFSVTKPPIFAENMVQNGWKVLMVKSGEKWRELVYKDGTYPSNPSVAPVSKNDAPSGNAIDMFSEMIPEKVYTF